MAVVSTAAASGNSHTIEDSASTSTSPRTWSTEVPSHRKYTSQFNGTDAATASSTLSAVAAREQRSVDIFVWSQLSRVKLSMDTVPPLQLALTTGLNPPHAVVAVVTIWALYAAINVSVLVDVWELFAVAGAVAGGGVGRSGWTSFVAFHEHPGFLLH